MEGVSIERVRAGEHACLVFTDSEERLDIVSAFVRDGLRGGEKVVCLTEAIPRAVLSDELRRRGLDVAETTGTGQLYVADSARFFLPDGDFDAERSIGLLRDQLAEAGRDGYRGLRVTSDMCWALRPVTGLGDLPAYESKLTALLAGQNATAVCQYDRQCFDTVTIASALETHSSTVTAVTYHDDSLARIHRQHMPPGIRVAGEVDYRAADALKAALAEALTLDHDLDVNLTELRFIDTTAAGVLVQAAAGLAAPRTMTVRCRHLPYEILAALGLRDLPGVTLKVVDDDR